MVSEQACHCAILATGISLIENVDMVGIWEDNCWKATINSIETVFNLTYPLRMLKLSSMDLGSNARGGQYSDQLPG